MIPAQMLAAAKVIRFAALVVAATFVAGFGLAWGVLAALKLLGWSLASWGCQ